MPAYTIQCYIETLSSDNKVTLRGCDGYKLLKDDKKYLIFIKNESDPQESVLFEEQTIFEIHSQNVSNNDEPMKLSDATLEDILSSLHSRNMFLFAQVNRKKVELEINLPSGNTTTIKITKIKLLQ